MSLLKTSISNFSLSLIYLDGPQVTGETLIDKMKEAACVESERKSKQEKNTAAAANR